MRSIVIWLSGAMLAFFVTAGAFLMLANLSGNLSVRNFEPKPAPSDSGPLLKLDLDETRLKKLERKSGQTLPLTVENTGRSDLSDISLTMRVTSENTAQPEARYYRATIKDLAAGGSKTVRFTLDLSPPDPSGRRKLPPGSLEPRSVLEVQATTPGGISSIRTVVLPL